MDQGRKAKRASLACVGCKRSKRKCDITKQLSHSDGCTHCRDRGEYCEVRHGEDKRKKRGATPKADIQRRLEALENIVTKTHLTLDQSTRVAASPKNQTHQVANAPSSLEATDATRPMETPGSQCSPSKPSQQGPETGKRRLSMQPVDQSHDASLGASPGTASLLQDFPDGISTAGASMIATSTACTDDANTIISKVISRENDFDPPRNDSSPYFGSTSIFHLSDNLRTRRPVTGDQPAAKAVAIDLPLEYDPSLEPEPIVTHLLDLFLNWHAPLLQIIKKDSFLADKKLFDKAGKTNRYAYFSPSLLYAIMALASMISPDRGVRLLSTVAGRVVGDTYFRKAKALFDMEMHIPTMTTVQTALLIGSYYGTLGQTSLGWTYSGIAVRMAFELGLHVSCEKAVQKLLISSEMAENRKMVFWGCYVQDKLWSAYCGRPSSIMDWHITVKEPLAMSRPDVVCDDADVLFAEVNSNIVLLAIQWSSIYDEVYSQKFGRDHEKLHVIAQTKHEDLLKWHSSLTTRLQWPNKFGQPSSPHVIIMHMQFYFTLLLLHRPFINFGRALRVAGQVEHTHFDAMAICTLAATNITKLSRDYSFFYDIRKIPSPAVHFIFTAATIHMINYLLANDANDQTLFEGCLSGLSRIGESYPFGTKAVSVLEDLVHQIHQCSDRSGLTQESGPEVSNANPVQPVIEEQSEARFQGRQPSQYPVQLTAAEQFNRREIFSTQDHDRQANHNSNRNASTVDHRSIIPDSRPPEHFDWSTCNSPVKLPPDLDHIEMQPFDMSFHEDLDASFDLFPIPEIIPDSAKDRNIDGLHSHIESSIFGDVNDPEHAARFMMERHYGTAFGLNQLR